MTRPRQTLRLVLKLAVGLVLRPAVGLVLGLASVIAPATMATATKPVGTESTVNVDTVNSHLNWTGKKLTGEHHGTLQIKQGSLTLNNGELVRGQFDVDMDSLKDLDLKDADTNKQLTTHLRSDDFFAIAKFPLSHLEIKKVSPLKASPLGNFQIDAQLTIKGKSNAIHFPAKIEFTKGMLHAKATISVDRTQFDIRYRSGRFVPNLGDKIIRDEFLIDVDLRAKQHQ